MISRNEFSKIQVHKGPNVDETQLNGDAIFWGELTPPRRPDHGHPACNDHLVHFYQDDTTFLEMLGAFATGGLSKGEAVIIIATAGHREALEQGLRKHGIDVDSARASDQYIDLDAEQTLGKFMTTLEGRPWPDEKRFEVLVNELLSRARASDDPHKGRRVRAFGEMVVILYERGGVSGMLQLERLWHKFCQEKAFCLFCAYPKTGFTDTPDQAMREIIGNHSRLVA